MEGVFPCFVRSLNLVTVSLSDFLFYIVFNGISRIGGQIINWNRIWYLASRSPVPAGNRQLVHQETGRLGG